MEPIASDLINSSVIVTLGCSEYGGGGFATSAGISLPTVTISGVSCPADVARTEQELSDFVFSGREPLELNGDTLTIGDPPEQLILQRTVAAPTTTTTASPATATQPPTVTTFPVIDPAAFGIWTLDTDDPSVAWLNLPKHLTLTVTISGLQGSPTLTTLSVTLGCIDYRAALHSLIPSVRADYPIVPAISCGSAFDQAEDHLVKLVFEATAVRLDDDELIFGDPPEQLILRRSSGAPSTSPTIDPAIYGIWEIAWDDPGLLIDLPDDTTLNVTVTEASAGSDHPWNLEITLGCNIWDTDLLIAHPYPAPLPDQIRADCGPLATIEHGVVFTILEGNYSLSIDGGDLIFGAPPQGFYMHPAN